MTKEEAINEFFKDADDTVFGKHFINWLYDRGYMIVTPEELEKIDGMTIMAHIHGMNPFEKRGK